MGKTAALLRFDEVDTSIQPSDAAGGLDDLVVPDELDTPPIVTGVFGRARQFPVGAGLVGAELVEHQLRLRRSMSIEATVSVDAQLGVNGIHMIVARGLRGSAAERRLYSLAIEVSGAPSAPVARLRMGWDRATTPAVVPAVAFELTEPGFVHVAATREWYSDSEVEVRYYANGAELGTFTVTGGDIVDGDGGHVTFGCEGNGAGIYTNHFLDAIDQVRISNVLRSAEEIAQDYRRMFDYQDWGHDALKALMPPGESFSDDPDSAIQRELAVEGDAIGFAWAQLEELVDDFLPDRATRTLDRWEETLRQRPGPHDKIPARRARLVGRLRSVHGYNVDQIIKAVAPLLDCAPADLVLFENTNTGPNPETVWLWFIYRDPLLPGRPDIKAAQRLLDEMKPAHTRGVIGQSTDFLFDDPNSLFDRDLLGV